jgi:hypothetical protein
MSRLRVGTVKLEPVLADEPPNGLVLCVVVSDGIKSRGAATCEPMLVQPLSVRIGCKPGEAGCPNDEPDSSDSSSQSGALVPDDPLQGGGATLPRVRELAAGACDVGAGDVGARSATLSGAAAADVPLHGGCE